MVEIIMVDMEKEKEKTNNSKQRKLENKVIDLVFFWI